MRSREELWDHTEKVEREEKILLIAIGMETGRGRGDQVPSGPAVVDPRLCFALLTSFSLGASTSWAHEVNHV